MPSAKNNHQPALKSSLIALITAATLVTTAGIAHAGSREQARRMYDRLTGVTPDNATITTLANTIDTDSAFAAAMDIIDPDEGSPAFNKNFYNVTLKNWVTPWTNEEQTVFAPLNDFTATVIGMVRDDKDFREVLYGNILYTGASGLGLTPYSLTNNTHYQEMEDQNLDLSDDTVLVERTQTGVYGPLGLDLASDTAYAGVMTTRQGARAYFVDGTNRAMFRFTMINFLGSDLEPLLDKTRVPDRIRQDVSRSPGGDSTIFLGQCIGCHAGMDGMMGAMAYYEWDYPDGGDADNGSLAYANSPNTYTIEDTQYTSRVQKKFRINPLNFEYGFFTTDDSWINYWRTGINANLGWEGNSASNPTPTTGNGLNSLGRELAHTQAFARYQVLKAYRAVCLKDPGASTLDSLTTRFETTHAYHMKPVFADAAVDCMGS
jgi:hypothetical protein